MRDHSTSLHGDLRRMIRGDFDNERTITEVWEQSFPCEVRGRHYDEARVDIIENIVLLKKNGEVVTVLDSNPEDIEVSSDECSDSNEF